MANKLTFSANVEKKIINRLKDENIIKVLRRYRGQILFDQKAKEEVPLFQNVLNNINYSILKLPGKPWEISYNFQDSSGTTRIYLHNDYMPNRSSLVFHHGLGMLNPLHIRLLVNSDFIKRYNIFSIKAAHHDSMKSIRYKCINTFINLTSVICASVLAVNEVVNFHQNNSDKEIVITGVSLGGIVTSLHYFYFNSADYYFPIVAYPNFGEILLNKNIKEFVTNQEKLSKNTTITKAFQIPKRLKNKPKNKIIPILARGDELISYSKAREFWKGYDTKTLDVGHNTIVTKAEIIRKIISSKMK